IGRRIAGLDGAPLGAVVDAALNRVAGTLQRIQCANHWLTGACVASAAGATRGARVNRAGAIRRTGAKVGAAANGSPCGANVRQTGEVAGFTELAGETSVAERRRGARRAARVRIAPLTKVLAWIADLGQASAQVANLVVGRAVRSASSRPRAVFCTSADEIAVTDRLTGTAHVELALGRAGHAKIGRRAGGLLQGGSAGGVAQVRIAAGAKVSTRRADLGQAGAIHADLIGGAAISPARFWPRTVGFAGRGDAEAADRLASRASIDIASAIETVTVRGADLRQLGD